MPYRREFELRDCSYSKLEELKCRYYKDLRDGEDRINGLGKHFGCPYCRDKRGKQYDMQRLLRHSYRRGYASKSSSLRDKARHLGLLEYLERHRYAKSNARHPSPIDPSTKGANEETFVWPWMGIVAYSPVVYEDGKFDDESGQKLKMELVAKGYNPIKVYTLFANRGLGFSGYAIVEFTCNFSGFANAMAFARGFELDKHGKQEWYSSLKDDNPYAWIAGKEEYNSNSIVGNYLRRYGELKTISEIQSDNRSENCLLFSNLINELDLKSKECEEMEKMISKTEALMGNVMKEKDEMLSLHNKELEMIHQEALKQVENILSERETRRKQQLDDREIELKLREDEIKQREKLIESEKGKLDYEKEMNERAILAQKKAYERMMELADEQKREKEQALVKIFRLERELGQKQALELEIEKLKGLVEVRRHMMEGDLAARNKLTSMIEELKQKEDEFDYLKNIKYKLIRKHRRVNYQVQDACEEMIIGLFELNDPCGNICVKIMGELDEQPFIHAASQKYPKEEAPDKALELCALWESYIRDPDWYPIKVIENGRKDIILKFQVWVIDEEDGKLVDLRKEYGDEVYNVVISALMELKVYDSNHRYGVLELWNSKEKRSAELKEGVELILKQWRTLKNRDV